MTDEKTVTVPPPLAKAAPKPEGSDVHAALAKLESELLDLPDYVVTRLKAAISELRATL